MLAFFQRITAEEAQQQTTKALAQSATQHIEHAAAREQLMALQRGPGRPKKVFDVGEALDGAADEEEKPAGTGPGKRGKYNNWFASDFIHDILHAYKQHGARRAVQQLQRAHPRLPTELYARFDGLNEATIRTWHGTDGNLLPQFQSIIDERRGAARRGSGYERILAGYPAVEDRVKQLLERMRERGAVINILIIRFVMQTVIESDASHLLENLKLSHGFISSWVREQLKWTWRMRTTAASKVPLDYQQQGIQMAKRIAYAMQVYKVRHTFNLRMHP
jgi:hypothetical protein